MSRAVSYQSKKINSVASAPVFVPVPPPVFVPVQAQAPPPVFVPVSKPNALEQINSAKKEILITIRDERFETLTVTNSCTIIFQNSSAERLEVIGEWVKVKLIGLTLYGESPLIVKGDTQLVDCRITSTKDPLRIASNKLILSRCELQVTGSRLFELADKADISVRDTQARVEDIMNNVSCFRLQGKSKVSVRDSRLKLRGTYCGWVSLFDVEPGNESYIKLFGTSIRARAGTYLTTPHPLQIKCIRSHCDQFQTTPFNTRSVPLIDALVADPLYPKRTFFVEESLVLPEAMHFSSRKLTFTGKSSLSVDLDIEGSIFIRSLSSSSFERIESDLMAKLLVVSIRTTATFHSCSFILSDLILEGELTFSCSRVYLRECRVNAKINCVESSIKCESVQFTIDSEFSAHSSKVKLLHCDFKSKPVFDNCQVLCLPPSLPQDDSPPFFQESLTSSTFI